MIDPTCWPRSAALIRPGTRPLTTCTRVMCRALAITSSSAGSNGSVPFSFASSAKLDHALAADLDDRGFRQDAEVRCLFRRGHKLWVGERALHQQALELRDRVRHPRHPLVF
jgi:hypothetical protein